MTISFSEVPEANLTPGFHSEVDTSNLSGGVTTKTVLIIGYSPTGPQLVPTLVQGDGQWPRNSQLGRMIRAYRRNHSTVTIYAIAISPPAGGAPAIGTLTVSGTATQSGTLSIWVGGKRIQVGVNNGDSATVVAAAIEAAIDADPDVLAGAGAVGAVVTVTTDSNGAVYNDLGLAVDPKETERGVDGISVAVVGFAGGAGDPTITDALDLVPGEKYSSIIVGFRDATTLTALEQEMVRRWQATVELGGHAFVGAPGTLAEMVTIGSARNAEHLTVMGSSNSQTPWWEWAAAAGARNTGKSNPVIGHSDLPLTGMDAPEISGRFDKSERDTLLKNGVSTFRVSGGGVVLDRIVTTKTERDGAEDFTELPITLWRTIETLREIWTQRIRRKYQNFAIASAPDVQPTASARILTPTSLRAEAVTWFREMRALGYVQDEELFRSQLNTAVNGLDPNRMDAFLPLNLIKELVTIASVVSVR
ncbi:MAG: phage tail sheath subtilisin-like domain-containing protein [Myxococcota bacterium]